MVKFDKNGWFIGQKINTKIQHEDYHIDLYPKTEEKRVILPDYDKSKYKMYGHTNVNLVEGVLKIVSFYQTKYKGSKFSEWYKKDSGALAIVGKSIKTKKTSIVKILILK